MAIPIIIASVAIAAALSAYAILQGKKNNNTNLAASEDYKPTMAQEGSVITLVYGRVRIPGNIIWYGNIESEKIKTKSGGMMGGKGGGQSSGDGNYRYYADCWQSIGLGKLSLIKTYVGDKESSIQASETTWNNGTQSSYPSGIEHANKLKGVAHIYIKRLFLGENTKQFPTIHFVVDRDLSSTGINYANLDNGNNPSAVVYDLLRIGGVSTSNLDIESFNIAANFWKNKGYGINLVFSEQQNVYEAIDKVLSYIPGILYVNENNQYALKAIDPLAGYDREISHLEMKDFSFNRKTWSQSPNDFHATFMSESEDFSDRVVVAQNPAAITLAGQKINQSVDLRCFRNSETASNRIWEIMKRDSYPAATVKFKSNLRFASMYPGEILRITHEDYGLAGTDFRISEISAIEIDKNEIEITAEQCVETLHDDNFTESGKTYWSPPDTELVAPSYMEVFEMPYTKEFGDEPTYLLLLERKKYFEDSFTAMVSQNSAGDYIEIDKFTTFSQRIKLEESYSDTYDIDDSAGILFSCPGGKLDLAIDSTSRANLFVLPKIIILGDEILAFQNITPLENEKYRLTGVVRGAFGTEKLSHSLNDLGWIAILDGNFINVDFTTFYTKLLFGFSGKELDPSLVIPFSKTYSGKAKKPRNLGRITATRNGNDVSVQIWPNSPMINGAGNNLEGVTDKEPPFSFIGDFEVAYGTTTEIKTSDNFIVTFSGAFTLTIKSRLNGYKSSGKTVYVGSLDDTYYG